jgi:hypothetical protein
VGSRPLNYNVRPQLRTGGAGEARQPQLAAMPNLRTSGTKAEMAKMSLRTASIYCFAVWAAIWLLFLLIRVSSFDIRIIPGIGPIMLMALVGSMVAPIVATGLAGAAVVRKPRLLLSWLIFGCAVIALLGQMQLFMSSKWL